MDYNFFLGNSFLAITILITLESNLSFWSFRLWSRFFCWAHGHPYTISKWKDLIEQTFVNSDRSAWRSTRCQSGAWNWLEKYPRSFLSCLLRPASVRRFFKAIRNIWKDFHFASKCQKPFYKNAEWWKLCIFYCLK